MKHPCHVGFNYQNLKDWLAVGERPSWGGMGLKAHEETLNFIA